MPHSARLILSDKLECLACRNYDVGIGNCKIRLLVVVGCYMTRELAHTGTSTNTPPWSVAGVLDARQTLRQSDNQHDQRSRISNHSRPWLCVLYLPTLLVLTMIYHEFAQV